MLKLGLFKNFKGSSILYTGLLLTFFSFLVTGCLDESEAPQVDTEREETLLKQYGTDTLLITDYLAKNNITNAQRTPSNNDYYIFYLEQVAGNGAQAQLQNTVKVHYTLSNLQGDLIQTTSGGQPAQFRLSGTVPGFQEGVSKMKVGGKSRLYIPSLLGYQDRPPQQQTAIKPNMVLVFDVELVEAL